MIAGNVPVLVHNCGFIGPQDHVAFGHSATGKGVDVNVKRFADQVGARHLMRFTADWQDQALGAIGRLGRDEGSISFMLDGLPGANRGVGGALQAARNAATPSATQWELLQLEGAGLLDKVNFYRWNTKLGAWSPVR